MSATAFDKISPELQLSGSNRQQIRKTFNLLKSHASAVAKFTLQWQDLEDHLQSIHNSIQARLDELQNPQSSPTPTKLPRPKSNPPKESESHSISIPIHDAKELVIHLKQRLKDHDSLRDDVRNALLNHPEGSGKLVLDAVGGFYPGELKPGVIDSELSAVRRSCLLLLEELMNVRPPIGSPVREEACKVALAWKAKMNPELVNSMEVFGFLMLLIAYGLAGEFDRDEILSLVGNVVQRKKAPELFKSLGLSDKASDFIQSLISQKKRLEAVRFIYAFELVDKFPPVPLLQDHLNDAKKASRTVWKNSKSSSKEKDDATNKELAALRGVIRCIEEYKLASEYSPEDLKERVEWLRKQKNERKAKGINAKHKAPDSKAQAQQLSGKKRAFLDSKCQTKNPQHINKNPRTAVSNLSARASATVHSVHHQPVGLYERERIEYLRQSARMAAAPATASSIVPARAAAVHSVHHHPAGLLEDEGAEYLLTSAVSAPVPGPNTSLGAASNFYSIEASRYQPARSFTGQGTQYSPGYYDLARSTIDAHASLQSGSHGLVASPTHRMSLTSGSHNLPGSIVDAHHVSSAHYRLADGRLIAHLNSSAEEYGTSGRNRQFGSPGARQHIDIPSNASPRSSLAYYPEDPLRVATRGDRPLSSSSGYDHELLSKRPNVFHL